MRKQRENSRTRDRLIVLGAILFAAAFVGTGLPETGEVQLCKIHGCPGHP